MSLNARYVGKKVFCGECGHRFVVAPNTSIVQTLKDKNDKTIGFKIKCEKCGENVFVVADRPK